MIAREPAARTGKWRVSGASQSSTSSRSCLFAARALDSSPVTSIKEPTFFKQPFNYGCDNGARARGGQIEFEYGYRKFIRAGGPREDGMFLFVMLKGKTYC